MRLLYPLTILACIFLSACQFAPEIAADKASKSIGAAHVVADVNYAVTQTIRVTNNGPGQPEKHNLWVALINGRFPQQQILSAQITPNIYTIIDDEYGNRFAEFDFQDLEPGESRQVEIKYLVAVQALSYDLGDCTGALPDMFNQPELHVESNNPQIIALAQQLSADQTTKCEQARAFYDYVGDNLVYTFNGTDWGAQAALGPMGADCTEYSSLLMALSRAVDIPARYVTGLLYLEAEHADLAQQEHTWVELYLPGSGWVPVDPTLGRSSITRDKHFANYTPHHIIVSYGRHPATLRGASYFTHLYWPGSSTDIRIDAANWEIRVEEME